MDLALKTNNVEYALKPNQTKPNNNWMKQIGSKTIQYDPA